MDSELENVGPTLSNYTMRRTRCADGDTAPLKSNGYPTKFIADVQRRQKKTKVTPQPEGLVSEFFALLDRPQHRVATRLCLI